MLNRQHPILSRRSGSKNKKSLLKTAIKIIVALFILMLISVVGIFTYFAKGLPDPSKISERNVIQSTKIYDRMGEVILYDIHGEEKRTVISFDQIPQNIKDATIVAEDDDFYKHAGFDIKGIIRSAWVDIINSGIAQGGSTITQQFIKNAILTSERTFTRKFKEIILAYKLEKKYSKNEILNLYLNQVPYGSNAYGIESAAITFFNKNASDLTLAESAILAALPNSTTYYSPYGDHMEELRERQIYILKKMLARGYITDDEFREAKNEELEFSQEYRGIKAPHFVMYIRSYLVDKYGEDVVEKDGLKVITTLDWEKQQIAEKIITNQSKINEENHDAKNAALVAMDPSTGEILSMVGSRDYFDLKNDGNVNVTIRPRQPGSSFKPFAYAQAIEKGFTPDTLLFDLKTEFNPNCPPEADKEEDEYGLKCYHPENYDLNFRGPVKLKRALAESLNLPSVKILYLAGIKDTIELAKKLGITTLTNPNRYGLSLVLGGGEVTLLEETSAYSAFANNGKINNITSILRIENGKGEVLEEFKREIIEGKQVIDQETARNITDILSDNNLRSPVFGENSYLNLGDRPAAVKTGTTQEYRDAWTIGYTPTLVVGVWVGNNYSTSMNKAPGASVAAPIWNKFMKEALKDEKIIEFTKPKIITTDKKILNGNFDGETYKIDKISGLLATEWTPPEFIREVIYLTAHNIIFYIDPKNPQGNNPDNPEKDPQFNNWEYPVIEWSRNNYCFKEKTPIEGTENFTEIEKCVAFNQEPPVEYDNTHTTKNKPQIIITSPQDKSTYKKGEIVRIETNTNSYYKISQVDLFIDNKLISGNSTQPYNFNFPIPINTTNNQYTIELKIYDSIGNSNSAKTIINIEQP